MRKKNFEPTAEEIEKAEAEIVAQSRRVDFYVTEYNVEILAKKVHEEEYFVPEYQREFTWDKQRKSRFLESLIMGLPIPFMFFWEVPDDGRLEIVDGSQRLRTIAEFIYGDFRLGDLNSLPKISHFRFKDFTQSRKRKILNRSLRGIVLGERADEAARLDMFERINTSSQNANQAEIRRGALAGSFLDLVKELAEDPLFHKLAPVSKKRKAQREYEELVTRFFAYSDGFEDYKDRPSEFLYNYCRQMNQAFDDDPKLASAYKDKFCRMLQFVDRNFPFGFAKSENGKATPRSRFESLSIGVANALDKNPDLDSHVFEADDVSWLTSQEFIEITGSDGANARSRLTERIRFVETKLG